MKKNLGLLRTRSKLCERTEPLEHFVIVEEADVPFSSIDVKLTEIKCKRQQGVGRSAKTPLHMCNVSGDEE